MPLLRAGPKSWKARDESEPRFRVAGLHPRLAFQNALESRLRGCFFRIALLMGLLEDGLNRRSAIFGNFVLPFP
jgi:hypothetical protein